LTAIAREKGKRKKNYSSKVAPTADPGADTEPITTRKLHGFVRLTLDLVHLFKRVRREKKRGKEPLGEDPGLCLFHLKVSRDYLGLACNDQEVEKEKVYSSAHILLL